MIESGYYWIRITEGWRIVEVDGDFYYSMGDRVKTSIKRLHGCELVGPLQEPVERRFTYHHPVVKYEEAAA